MESPGIDLELEFLEFDGFFVGTTGIDLELEFLEFNVFRGNSWTRPATGIPGI